MKKHLINFGQNINFNKKNKKSLLHYIVAN